ncbi:peptide-methionine-S-sulfoxide reductase [Ascoidea rubescens DSM 1968]|uniref:peptide-methionine (S)-S-oxide reductase n=1 Tax=Ascoidea rubescens DSM 1968 TaxID=1344418 RepID=A0A1D2VRX1_9ASCO|nr:peptide methionine sulfoxide reductase [Ascoidea rubescens DSM 1968]ODV64354.1 peptide methionine sulfoxide reductase [Ascoidea rubescens DSM 1968]
MSLSTVSSLLKVPEGSQIITLAAGCFWGTEMIYRKHFGDGKGLIDCKVGYANGFAPNPSYKQVCGGQTNHAEALQISFDPKIVEFKTLIDFFFKMHDPTTVNRQGPDIGTQYRSAIFTHNQQQLVDSVYVKESLQKSFYLNHKIVTQIEPITQFWDAEAYHQKYLINNPSGYECPTHFLRTQQKV